MSESTAKIEELFSGLESMDLKNAEALVEKLVSFFMDLKNRLNSSDPDEQKAAMEEGQILQQKLQAMLDHFCQSQGIDLSAIQAYMSNIANTNPKKSKEFERLVQKIEQMNDVDQAGEDLGLQKRKFVKDWVQG